MQQVGESLASKIRRVSTPGSHAWWERGSWLDLFFRERMKWRGGGIVRRNYYQRLVALRRVSVRSCVTYLCASPLQENSRAQEINISDGMD